MTPPPQPDVPAGPASANAPAGLQGAAVGQPTLEHRFNDDLLISEEDRALARRVFASIFHILDHPDLRQEFLRYDELAKKAKGRVHGLGLVAVALATVALLSSALSPLLALGQQVPVWVERVSLGIEAAGLVGAAIAVGGLWLGGWKKKWLEARLMVERLRLWHFQLWICKGREIEASCDFSDPQAQEKFRAARAAWFSVFKHESEGNLDALLHSLVERPEVGYEWLHQPTTAYSAASPVLEQLVIAYKQLRMKHQAHYAAHKMKHLTDQPLWRPLGWPLAVLESRTEALATLFLISALLVSCGIVIGYFLGWPSWVLGAALPGAITSLMVLGMATRAVQDGLALHAEMQRYSDYTGRTDYLLMRFNAASETQEQQLELMKEMERTALGELKSFLRAHSEARFVA